MTSKIIVLITIMCVVFVSSAICQNMPSTVTVQQWHDSWLAKWQSSNPDDQEDALKQLASLLLIIEPNHPLAFPLKEKLMSADDENIDAATALAFQQLREGFNDQAAQSLLNLILSSGSDSRIQRFRIALGRAFRLDERFDLSAAQLEPVIDDNTPYGRWALLEQARLYRAMNEFKLSLDTYQKITNSQASAYLKKIARHEYDEVAFLGVLSEESTAE